MKTSAILLAPFLFLSSCIWQNSQPTDYPMTAADIPAQEGDIITELNARTRTTKDGGVELFYPVINHSVALRAFKQHVANGLPVNTTDSFGLPAVAHAAAVGDVPFLTELIARGAELNYPAALNRPEPGNSCIFGGDDLSATALAAKNGQTAALELLLRHGAHPYGVPLAISHDHFDCLNLLHAAGGDLHEGEYTFDDELYPNSRLARSLPVLIYLITNGVSRRIPLSSLAGHSTDREAVLPYIDMYLRTGIWSPQQAEQFLDTYYPSHPSPPAP